MSTVDTVTEKITINVDGVDAQVTPGQPLIEALREAGVSTPNFCYHPDLSVAGNCRVCLAEVEGPRGSMLAISCHMPIRPGLVVRTQVSSEKVRVAREGVMEFLLVNHPLDCPVCDKAGECTLQEHYMSSGGHESRLHDEVGKQYKGSPDHSFIDSKGVKRGGKQVDLGPTVVLDQERCISCSRCVRFMNEVAKDEQLGLAGRGDQSYITTFPGEDLDHEYDLCTTDVCPVGALTGKHFRFQQRVWFLKHTESITPFDSLGANITIDFNKDEVWRFMPRRNTAVNASWLSNSDRMRYTDLKENRLLEGMVDGTAASLHDSYMAIGAALKSAKNIAIVVNGQLSNEDNAAFLALADKTKADVYAGSWLPVSAADGIARSGDPVGNRRGLEMMGITDNIQKLIDTADSYDCLLILGQDLCAEDADKASELAGIRTRIFVGSWNNATSTMANYILPIRCWAEARGTMVNCNNHIQMLQACPVCPNQDMDEAWQAAVRLSAACSSQPLPWASAMDAWKEVQKRAPALADIQYRAIGSQGLTVESATVAEVAL